jgi:hypothetical protein
MEFEGPSPICPHALFLHHEPMEVFVDQSQVLFLNLLMKL